jgi:hypothetical protein
MKKSYTAIKTTGPSEIFETRSEIKESIHTIEQKTPLIGVLSSSTEEFQGSTAIPEETLSPHESQNLPPAVV